MGTDCSGFVQQVFKVCGYHLTRDARLQVAQGAKVDSLEVALPGDLAFFNNDQGKIDHVGILLESGHIIRASGMVRTNRIDQQGIFTTTTGTYTHKLTKIRRILK